MRDIAKLWGVPISEAGILYPCKPEIQVLVDLDAINSDILGVATCYTHVSSQLQNLFTEVRIGRVTLQRTETVVSETI